MGEDDAWRQLSKGASFQTVSDFVDMEQSSFNSFGSIQKVLKMAINKATHDVRRQLYERIFIYHFHFTVPTTFSEKFNNRGLWHASLRYVP